MCRRFRVEARAECSLGLRRAPLQEGWAECAGYLVLGWACVGLNTGPRFGWTSDLFVQ